MKINHHRTFDERCSINFCGKKKLLKEKRLWYRIEFVGPTKRDRLQTTDGRPCEMIRVRRDYENKTRPTPTDDYYRFRFQQFKILQSLISIKNVN